MGEVASARTERELADLRALIEGDVQTLKERAKGDLDVRALARRQPVAVFGALGSVGAAAGLLLAAKVRERKQHKPESEIDKLINRLGGNVEKLRGRARKRLRESIRSELSEVEKPKRSIQEVAWGVGVTALTAAATTLARGFAGRLTRDDVVAAGVDPEGAPR